MSGRRVYLAGPMRGYPLWNFPAFDRWKERLSFDGWDVVSPADLDREAGFHETTEVLPVGFMEAAMRRDIAALLSVDAIALMPGWQDSSGACFEHDVAQRLGLEIIHLARRYPFFSAETAALREGTP